MRRRHVALERCERGCDRAGLAGAECRRARCAPLVAKRRLRMRGQPAPHEPAVEALDCSRVMVISRGVGGLAQDGRPTEPGRTLADATGSHRHAEERGAAAPATGGLRSGAPGPSPPRARLARPASATRPGRRDDGPPAVARARRALLAGVVEAAGWRPARRGAKHRAEIHRQTRAVGHLHRGRSPPPPPRAGAEPDARERGAVVSPRAKRSVRTPNMAPAPPVGASMAAPRPACAQEDAADGDARRALPPEGPALVVGVAGVLRERPRR